LGHDFEYQDGDLGGFPSSSSLQLDDSFVVQEKQKEQGKLKGMLCGLGATSIFDFTLNSQNDQDNLICHLIILK